MRLAAELGDKKDFLRSCTFFSRTPHENTAWRWVFVFFFFTRAFAAVNGEDLLQVASQLLYIVGTSDNRCLCNMTVVVARCLYCYPLSPPFRHDECLGRVRRADARAPFGPPGFAAAFCDSADFGRAHLRLAKFLGTIVKKWLRKR